MPKHFYLIKKPKLPHPSKASNLCVLTQIFIATERMAHEGRLQELFETGRSLEMTYSFPSESEPENKVPEGGCKCLVLPSLAVQIKRPWQMASADIYILLGF